MLTYNDVINKVDREIWEEEKKKRGMVMQKK